jgi:hypothetical protein
MAQPHRDRVDLSISLPSLADVENDNSTGRLAVRASESFVK